MCQHLIAAAPSAIVFGYFRQRPHSSADRDLKRDTLVYRTLLRLVRFLETRKLKHRLFEGLRRRESVQITYRVGLTRGPAP